MQVRARAKYEPAIRESASCDWHGSKVGMSWFATDPLVEKFEEMERVYCLFDEKILVHDLLCTQKYSIANQSMYYNSYKLFNDNSYLKIASQGM